MSRTPAAPSRGAGYPQLAINRLRNPSQLIKALVREGLDRGKDDEVRDPDVSAALSHLDAVRRTLIDND
jgi:hypothetical protein